MIFTGYFKIFIPKKDYPRIPDGFKMVISRFAGSTVIGNEEQIKALARFVKESYIELEPGDRLSAHGEIYVNCNDFGYMLTCTMRSRTVCISKWTFNTQCRTTIKVLTW